MASGPEHYAEAERLLDQAEVDARDPMRKYAEDANLIAAAQVHATLALAAATALEREHFVTQSWLDVAS